MGWKSHIDDKAKYKTKDRVWTYKRAKSLSIKSISINIDLLFAW